MADEMVYRDLRPGEVIQPGDEWQTESGRWALFHQSMLGQTSALRSRRPYNITQLQKEQREASEVVAIWQRAVHDLATKNQHLTAELARLQSPPPANHIADVSKMVETELERKAWELWLRGDDSIEDAWRKAARFITERNRRRQIQRENDAIIADVAGD